ncbi:MAG: hypothetical protein P1U50_01080 [Parvibaculaceae bacterium]|nr:hypothetical protein [Parvibaculaceae bacterium]
MALKLELDSLDGLDDAMKGLYEESDGKFKLAVEGLEDTSGLHSALTAERETRKKAEKEAAIFKRAGKTPEEIQELIEAQQKREEDDAKKRGDFEAIRKQDAEKFNAEREQLTSELEKMRASERSAIIETQLTSSLAKAGFTEEGLGLLPGVLSNRIKIETIDGNRKVQIFQEDGETPLAGSNKDGTANFEDLAKLVATQYPSLVSSTAKGGSGKQPGSAGRSDQKQMLRSEFDGLSAAEKAEIAQSGVKLID